MKSNLDLVKDTDLFPYEDERPADFRQMHDGLYTLVWEDDEGQYPIGYVLDRVFQELQRVPIDVRGEMDVDKARRTVRLFCGLPTEADRSRAAAALASFWREQQTFRLLRGWRGELLPVYGRRGELLFSIEREALGLLGAMRYGVHMMAYVADADAPHGIRLWVSRRAANKSTFPGMLDNTVAGGLVTGEEPFESLVREADEEASLPEDVVRGSTHAAGTITYMYISDERYMSEGGFFYPECQWLYDLELPADVIPRPKDGEVAEFHLCSVDEVKRDLAAGAFKTNCAVVVLDFFDRHGILTEDNEPDLRDMRWRIHRDLPFPGPHQEHWAKA